MTAGKNLANYSFFDYPVGTAAYHDVVYAGLQCGNAYLLLVVYYSLQNLPSGHVTHSKRLP